MKQRNDTHTTRHTNNTQHIWSRTSTDSGGDGGASTVTETGDARDTDAAASSGVINAIDLGRAVRRVGVCICPRAAAAAAAVVGEVCGCSAGSCDCRARQTQGCTPRHQTPRQAPSRCWAAATAAVAFDMTRGRGWVQRGYSPGIRGPTPHKLVPSQQGPPQAAPRRAAQ